MLDGIISRKKEFAASIQQRFDIYIYTMPWDTRIFGKNSNLNNEIASYSSKILNNPQEAPMFEWLFSIIRRIVFIF